MLHKWKPHGGKKLSGIIFLDNLRHPNIKELVIIIPFYIRGFYAVPFNFHRCALWKWALTSAENNTELKLWSCENWECHQTIRFQSPDSNSIYQKMSLDLSASFLLLTDIHRKVIPILFIRKLI